MDARCLGALVDGIVDSGARESTFQLTAATLPAAETAPTARVDCRRAFRNILEVYGRFGDERRAIAAGCNWEEGRLGSAVLPLQESKWRFLRRMVMESRVCLRDRVGFSCSDSPITIQCAVLPGYSEAALTIS